MYASSPVWWYRDREASELDLQTHRAGDRVSFYKRHGVSDGSVRIQNDHSLRRLHAQRAGNEIPDRLCTGCWYSNHQLWRGDRLYEWDFEKKCGSFSGNLENTIVIEISIFSSQMHMRLGAWFWSAKADQNHCTFYTRSRFLDLRSLLLVVFYL